MGSNNYDGTDISQVTNVYRVHHNGDKLVQADTDNDLVVAREDDTSFIPAASGGF